MEKPLAPLMGPEHPAGDEIAEHSGGDERNRTQENGNTVTMFHPPRHSSLPHKKETPCVVCLGLSVTQAMIARVFGHVLPRRRRRGANDGRAAAYPPGSCGPDGLMGVGKSTAPMLVSSMLAALSRRCHNTEGKISRLPLAC
jgi:hypothetical protein